MCVGVKFLPMDTMECDRIGIHNKEIRSKCVFLCIYIRNISMFASRVCVRVCMRVCVRVCVHMCVHMCVCV